VRCFPGIGSTAVHGGQRGRNVFHSDVNVAGSMLSSWVVGFTLIGVDSYAEVYVIFPIVDKRDRFSRD